MIRSWQFGEVFLISESLGDLRGVTGFLGDWMGCQSRLILGTKLLNSFPVEDDIQSSQIPSAGTRFRANPPKE
jgi:hypothetical protein